MCPPVLRKRFVCSCLFALSPNKYSLHSEIRNIPQPVRRRLKAQPPQLGTWFGMAVPFSFLADYLYIGPRGGFGILQRLMKYVSDGRTDRPKLAADCGLRVIRKSWQGSVAR